MASEDLLRTKVGYYVSDDLKPTQKHQIQEELLQFQKELGAAIYFQRIREKRG